MARKELEDQCFGHNPFQSHVVGARARQDGCQLFHKVWIFSNTDDVTVDEAVVPIPHWEWLNLIFSSQDIATADDCVVTREVRTIEDIVVEMTGEQDDSDGPECESATQVHQL